MADTKEQGGYTRRDHYQQILRNLALGAVSLGAVVGVVYLASSFIRANLNSTPHASSMPTVSSGSLLPIQTIDVICGSGTERFIEINGEKFYSRMDDSPAQKYCGQH